MRPARSLSDTIKFRQISSNFQLCSDIIAISVATGISLEKIRKKLLNSSVKIK